MTAPSAAAPVLSARSTGIAVNRRSLPAFLRAVIRNPLEALPPEAYSEPLVYARLGGRDRLYVCDPALIHEVLVRHADHLDKNAVTRRVLSPVLGQGLLTAGGAHWRWQRQATSPAFQHAKLLAFLPAMIAAAEATVRRWRAAGPDATLDLGHEMMVTTFAIIVDTMLSGPEGLDVGRIEGAITAYLGSSSWAAALGIVGAPAWAPYPGRRRAQAAARYLRAAVGAMVARRRAAGGEAQDLVALLLEAADPETGRRMSDAEITDNLLTFILAGHETTALGLSWAFHLLAAHPAVEAAVVAEVEAAAGDGPLRPAQVNALGYCRQVFSEAMRLYPPAPLVIRHVDRPFVLAGHTVPAGTDIVVPMYAVHRQARLWPDPLRFDPGRFAPAAAKARHRYSFMPFGAGPRTCIGSAFATMEAVAILAVLLRAFRVVPAEAVPPPPAMRVTLRPSRPLRVRVVPR